MKSFSWWWRSRVCENNCTKCINQLFQSTVRQMKLASDFYWSAVWCFKYSAIVQLFIISLILLCSKTIRTPSKLHSNTVRRPFERSSNIFQKWFVRPSLVNAWDMRLETSNKSKRVVRSSHNRYFVNSIPYMNVLKYLFNSSVIFNEVKDLFNYFRMP